MNITNVLIVQFSTRIRSWEEKAYNGDESLRNKWFEFRSNIFRKGLAQCIQHQTKQVSKIYLLLDEHDVGLYNTYLQDVAYTPIWCGQNKLYFAAQIRNDLTNNGDVENYLISRIDSDDLVSKNYFKNISEQITKLPCKLITACAGHRSDLTQIQEVFHSNSPFVSEYFAHIKQGSDRPISIYNFSHSDLFKMPHKKNVDAEWMQLIHGNNVINSFAASHPAIYAAELNQIDSAWFKEWAGFDLPSPTILHQTFKSI